MFWPFGRRRRKPRVTSTPSHTVFDEFGPLSIPIDDTEYETVVITLLERAVEESRRHAPGELFSVSLTEEEMAQVAHPAMVVGPVFMRAPRYGLMPETAYNEEFTFYRDHSDADNSTLGDPASAGSNTTDVLKDVTRDDPEDFSGVCEA